MYYIYVKNIALFALITLQLIIIVFLFIKVNVKSSQTLGVSINTYDYSKKMSMSTNATKLNYFYEPVANSVFTESLPWSPEQKVKFDINTDTLNGPEPIIRDNNINFIALGDSFTFGQYINRKDNWVQILEGELKKDDDNIQVLNFGVEGYDIEYAVERFRIRGQKYNPRLLIWFLKGDDFISIAERLTIPIEHEKYLFEKNNIKNNSTQDTIDGKILQPPYITSAVESFVKEMGGLENIYKYQMDILKKIRKYYHGNILVIHLPLEDRHLKLLKDWQKIDNKVILLQLPDQDDSVIFPDTHPNIKGHRNIANAVFNFLHLNNYLFK